MVSDFRQLDDLTTLTGPLQDLEEVSFIKPRVAYQEVPSSGGGEVTAFEELPPVSSFSTTAKKPLGKMINFNGPNAIVFSKDKIKFLKTKDQSNVPFLSPQKTPAAS